MADRVGDALDRLLVGVLRLARDLRAALDAAERRADGGGEGGVAHAHSSLSVLIRTLRVSGTL